jgi:hypothetical protein
MTGLGEIYKLKRRKAEMERELLDINVLSLCVRVFANPGCDEWNNMNKKLVQSEDKPVQLCQHQPFHEFRV